MQIIFIRTFNIIIRIKVKDNKNIYYSIELFGERQSSYNYIEQNYRTILQ